MQHSFWICALLYGCIPVSGIILVIPEDVPAGLAAIYGFAPRLIKGNDHRLGFGFRLGNHADFQVTYELGPQAYTRPQQQPARIRSATYRQRLVRRRPFLELLLSLGILKEATYEFTVVNDDIDNEPR